TLQGQEWDIGSTPRMRAISDVVASCAPESVSVLIQGDTGTGKEVVARAIHARSPRADGAFVAINCAALPENLLESELFGHEKGAFTDAKTLRRGLLELGHGGTVFLDEVTMMSPAMQAKLLRALQDRKIRRIGGSCELNIDIRVLAAANVDVVAAIAEGTFREDLYYRLAVFTIELPPLKDRRVDIPMFVDKFLKELHSKHQVSDAALAAMTEYQWPGNIRELRNVIERAVIVAAGEDTLDMHHLPQAVREAAVPVSTNGAHPLVPPGVTGLPAVLPEGGLSMKAVEHAWEQDLVEQALERTDGNQTRAATLLGLTRDELRYRVEKFRLAGDPDQED
ncbi:MAG: sigma-54 interaction domain-containing protein, partial [Anaerolineae bacterium]